MKLSVVLVLLLVVPALAHAAEQNYMTVELLEDGSAHVTLESKNPRNLGELRALIEDPNIKSIYQGSLSSIFGEIENLDVRASSDSIIIEFDCKMAGRKGKEWVINKIDFEGELDPVSTLEVELPTGSKLKTAEPWPAEISENVLTWHDVNYIPGMTYGRGGSHRPALLVLIVVITAAGTLFALKRKS